MKPRKPITEDESRRLHQTIAALLHDLADDIASERWEDGECAEMRMDAAALARRYAEYLGS
jgi:hypothetical protein